MFMFYSLFRFRKGYSFRFLDLEKTLTKEREMIGIMTVCS